MLNHGGQLQRMQAKYPAQTHWVDASTGIAPWSWPVPHIPASVWQRLPESQQPLATAAARFYLGNSVSADEIRHRFLPVAGSQVAIEQIPLCVAVDAVALPLLGYGEHRQHWQEAGHCIHHYQTFAELIALLAAGHVSHAVVINPNNPTGEQWSSEQIAQCLGLLPEGGLLIVDEAFAELDGITALALGSGTYAREKLVVLRSVGKFFGMAGLRLGFVIAPDFVRRILHRRLPLWGISHPALWCGEKMLLDDAWHAGQRARICHARDQLHEFLQRYSWPESVCIQPGPLFISLFTTDDILQSVYETCAANGLLLRYFQPQKGIFGLRIGLVAEDDWLFFSTVLHQTLAAFLPAVQSPVNVNESFHAPV